MLRPRSWLAKKSLAPTLRWSQWRHRSGIAPAFLHIGKLLVSVAVSLAPSAVEDDEGVDKCHYPGGVTHDYIKTGGAIYARSFEIIREESNLERFPEDVEFVAVRMIHAAADPAIADLIAFSPGVAAAGLAALEAGAPILCDSSMVASGIIRSRLPEHTEVICHIKDPRLQALAGVRGITKAAAAVDLWHEEGLFDGSVVAIGNAPTALFRVLEVMKETGVRPAAIVGIPVGFVGAAESKDALVADPGGAEYITVLGRRGGSAMAVAAVNAIASRAETTNDRR